MDDDLIDEEVDPEDEPEGVVCALPMEVNNDAPKVTAMITKIATTRAALETPI